MTAVELRTDRLLLRGWLESDREPFAAMNGDPHTMRYFPNQLSRVESDALADRIAADLDRDGYGLWAVEVVDVAPFIGFVGLSSPGFDAPFLPAIEIGWRIAAQHHGHGYALEAARRVLTHAFTSLGLESVVSFTSELNDPSRRLMARLGMEHDPNEDFDHPRPAIDSPLRRHVLYRATATRWLSSHRFRRLVREPWTASQEHALVLAEGDIVFVGRRDDEWPAYRWCAAPGGEASWLPEAILDIAKDGTARAKRAYSAAELTVRPGDTVATGERISGWTWCSSDAGRAGWVPDRVLGA